MRRLIWACAALAAMLLLIGANTGRNVVGWQFVAETPAERRAMLEPGWRLILPDGAGPHPAAVLLPGCDGVHDNMDLWARVLRAQGRAVLILDSHGPRGLTRWQSWRAVCAGQVLTGAERAGDLAVALSALAGMPQIARDDVLLLGASHGGWSVMELMARLGGAVGADVPPGLTDWPDAPETYAARIGRVVLLYPYCGALSSAAARGWPDGIQSLMLLAEHDRITSPDDCRAMAAALAGQGTDIAVETIAGVDHGFDQRDRSALSPLRFDAAATAKAAGLIGAFASAPDDRL